MFIKGSLYIANDINIVNNAMVLPNNKTLDLDEFGKILDQNNPNVVRSTCLLPPPNAIIAEIDGDHEQFVSTYRSYLCMDVISDFISVIIQAMHLGTNFIMFIPEMSEDSVWVNELILYFMTQYGIKIGTSPTDVFAYDERATSQNALLLYMYGYIDPYEFLFYYTEPIYPAILEKLINDVKPAVIDNNYQAHFESLKNTLKARPNAREAFSMI